jgi:uncharacterized membrane protein YbhN (UPF0104 family)
VSPPEGPTPPPRWRRVLRGGWLLVVAGGIAYALVDRWDEISPRLAQVEPWPLTLSAALGVVGVGLSLGIWRALLAGLGHQLDARAAAQVFFVGQLGKYLPGSVWPVVAQAELGRDHGVPPRASFAAVTLFLWVHLVTGGIVAAVTLATAGVVPWAVSLLALPGLALLAPTPLAWLLGRGARIVRRRPFERLPDTATMRRAAGWAAAMWIAYAAHLAAALTAFEAGAPLTLAAGAFAAAWCAGFLFLIAPAGAGARDVAMIALLSIGVAAAPAIAAVLASRLLLTLADVGWGLAGLVAGRRRVASAVARSDRRR